MKVYLLPLTVSLATLNALPVLPAMASTLEDEVVITASHVPISQSKSANALTVITSRELEMRAPVAVSDILRNVPGLAVSRNGVLGSSTQIRVRGAEGNHLLVLIDGVEANDPSQSDEVNWGTLTATDIERIEIIRGPQSALYGSDAVAGVVNIITKSADSPLSISAFAEGGSFDTSQYGATIGHKSDQFDIRFAVTDLDAEGDNISRQGDENDGYQNTTYSLKSGWTPTDDLRFTLSSRLQEGRNEFDAVDFYVTGLPVDADVSSEFYNQTTRIQGEYSTLNDTWLHRLAFTRTDNDNENFDVGIETGSTSSVKEQLQYLTSIQWADQNQTVSMLLEDEQEDFKQRGPVTDFGDDPNQDLSRDTQSVGVEYRGTYFDALTFAASVRYDDNSEFKDATTYKLEASYAVSDTTRLRSAWGTAVKNPTFTERFGFYASSAFFPFVGNPNLKPEESESWEVGIDQTLIDGVLDVSLTWFTSDLENEINGFYFDPTSFATTAVNVEGGSNRQGVELGVNAALSDSWALSAAYTYTDSTQEGEFSGKDVDELRRARHIASTTLDWQVADALQINLNVQYNGTQNDQFFPPYPQPSQTLQLDSYTLVNLNATYTLMADLDLYAKVENLLDEEYEEVYGFATPGIGGYMGVRYRFSR